MVTKNMVSRRKFTVTAASIGLASIAGCSSDGSNQTPAESETDSLTSTSTETDTQTERTTTETETTDTTTDSVETVSGTPEDKVSDGVIETLADYEYVAENPDDFVGTTVSTSEIKYYDNYGEYEGFRMFFRNSDGSVREVRPFFIRMDDEMTQYGNLEYSMEGTVEKVEELQDIPVIHMENDTILENLSSGETVS